jgi:hypothetical protein
MEFDMEVERSYRLMISPKELESLTEWIKPMDPQPHKITLIGQSTGIGFCLRAEIETAEGEGRWKDITDYENW